MFHSKLAFQQYALNASTLLAYTGLCLYNFAKPQVIEKRRKTYCILFGRIVRNPLDMYFILYCADLLVNELLLA
jgi:hypothetical protein